MSGTKQIAAAGVIAALYATLTLVFLPISFGPVQLRISEMLIILTAFLPAAVWGVACGCFIGNVLGGAVLYDIIFGSLATLIGAVITERLTRGMRKAVISGEVPAGVRFRLYAALPSVISNTIIVPLVLKYAYGFDEALYFMGFTILIGEILGIGLLGNIAMSVLLKIGFFRRFV